MTTTESADAVEAGERRPVILKLTISRFRGIEDVSWSPGPGVNIVLGGGDAGKSTILRAVELLLAPTNSIVLSDADYYGCAIDGGFEIEGILSLPSESNVSQQALPNWPWTWTGADAVVPSIEGPDEGTACYRLRVRGTPELDLVHEIVQPDGSARALSVSLRRSIGLVQLGGDGRDDRDLRLLKGSALDRLLSDASFRSRLTSELAKAEVKDQLSADAKDALHSLERSFRDRALPGELSLGLIGGRGLSISALIGLTAGEGGTQLPLTSWGAGTRRLAALAVAEANHAEKSIVVVDEVERGLEPYRQRTLMDQLRASGSQAFVTTHSPFALAAGEDAVLWHMDLKGSLGPLTGEAVSRQRETAPQTFLSRLAVIAEGDTEVGFVKHLLEKALGRKPNVFGVHVTSGIGNEATLLLLEALAEAGLRFGGFVDDEGGAPTKWERLQAELGDLLFRWESGCIEENVIPLVSPQRISELIEDPDGELTGYRLRTLATRLDTDEKDLEALKKKAGGAEKLRSTIVQAALGRVPSDVTDRDEKKQYKSHAKTWFKSERGGCELAQKVWGLDLWPVLRPQLLPFVNAVRGALELTPLEEL